MKTAGGVVLPAHVRRMILAHARADRPRECCGFLVGRAHRVSFAVPMRNIARGTARYRIRPAEHITVRRILRLVAPQMTIVGVYHSHPAGRAWPSATDVREAHYSNWVYVIVGFSERRSALRAFRIARGRVSSSALSIDRS